MSTNQSNQSKKLQAGSNTLREDSEGGLFENDISNEGGVFDRPYLLEVTDEKPYREEVKEITDCGERSDNTFELGERDAKSSHLVDEEH
jgi:hypothetical protein